MSEIDSDYQALANEPSVSIGVPENEINLKFVLMALREEIIEVGLRIANRDTLAMVNVVIPSLSGPIDIWYENGNIIIKRLLHKKRYRLPCEFEDGKISENIIDILCAFIIHNKMNKFKL